MTKKLDTEIATYEKMKENLEKNHSGKFVLIVGKDLIGTYDSFDTAANEGLVRFGEIDFLIRQVGVAPPTLSPAVYYGLTGEHRTHQS